jgi:hypothetical protein
VAPEHAPRQELDEALAAFDVRPRVISERQQKFRWHYTTTPPPAGSALTDPR